MEDDTAASHQQILPKAACWLMSTHANMDEGNNNRQQVQKSRIKRGATTCCQLVFYISLHGSREVNLRVMAACRGVGWVKVVTADT